MKFDRPIMIVCTGRSGSTVFYRILARHRDVGFLSTLNQQFPPRVWMSVFSNLYGMPLFNSIRDHRLFPKPFSPYKFWEKYLPGIMRHDRPLFPEDVPAQSIEPLRRAVATALKLQNARRFVMKVTGWARMAYFERIFPGMRFIYLKRQPLDVVSSWIQAGWLNVTTTFGSEDWEWGKVPDDYVEIYNELGGGALLSAAIKTQLDIDDIRNNMALFPGRCFELNYEDFVADPEGQMRETLEFCEMSWYPEFAELIRKTPIINNTNKWRKFMSEADGEIVQEFYRRIEATNQQFVAAAV